jgi:hypothetical protein
LSLCLLSLVSLCFASLCLFSSSSSPSSWGLSLLFVSHWPSIVTLNFFASFSLTSHLDTELNGYPSELSISITPAHIHSSLKKSLWPQGQSIASYSSSSQLSLNWWLLNDLFTNVSLIT